jgi:hypothetical protein
LPDIAWPTITPLPLLTEDTPKRFPERTTVVSLNQRGRGKRNKEGPKSPGPNDVPPDDRAV